ncbi:cytochrome b/b6 domain-containing protein [Ramlibacter sp. USB13]|uniref:Cytochrome b/b6 domain-containing protein n=1 Tax=Ramlibacter cellulosilyticus TaxID=2764187 RepID=A0A923MPB5_9BURK|nr:cytochrome b/b6 domain-containing protein [Ramlibacter cellulosilyticus]MBC5783020.1 cytochrome b/b6 domain-containing protein [Ramlibacter cellulosilyticus]
MPHRVRVWDLPTRLFHWALVACVVLLVITGYVGGDAMQWHARFGYAVLTLLLFRLVWGFIGGRWSRFRSFLYAPSSVLAYVGGRAHPDHLVGHNPLGAGSVFAMLLVLLAQVGTGLFADDEIAFTGPLNRFVQGSTGLAATWYHKSVGQWLIVGLVVLHVAAIVYYLKKKRENLVRPMVVGDKDLAAPAEPSRDDTASRVVALVVLAVCAGVVAWIASLGAGGGSSGGFN